MNPDMLKPGERCASTSNRNFEGRQGKGGRTHLVSPAMAAAAAIAGHFVDVREWASRDSRSRLEENQRCRPFKNFTGMVAPLDRANVDTDQIIPKQFLKAVVRRGLKAGLFIDWRRNPDGSENQGFRAEQAALPGRDDPGGAQRISAAAVRASMRCGR